MSEAIERRDSAGMAESEPYGEAAANVLFGTQNPFEIVARSVEVSDVLMRVVQDRGLAFRFGDRDWYGLGCYQVLGSFFGVTTSPEWIRPIADGSGWEARFVVYAPDGRPIGAGEGMVTRDEKNWRSAPAHSLRAMAQVRGQRRALQSVLGFVVQLAGYDISDPDAPATRKQVTALHTIASGLGWSDEERHERAGVASFNDLTREAAGDLFDAWSALDPETAAAAAPDPEPPMSLIDTAWRDALERFDTKVGVLQAAIARWPERRGGVSASSLTVDELQELTRQEPGR